MSVPDFAPGSIADDTARKYFEAGGRSQVQENRWFLIAVILALVLIIESIAISFLFPLKSIETIVVTKSDGGRLASDGTTVGNWVPENDAIAYFINKWCNSVFDVNRVTINGTIKESAEIAVGTAAAQLRELREKDNPLISLKNDPEYSRSYEYISINFIQDNVAFLRFKTITRRGNIPQVSTFAMRVTFTRVKPTTRSEVMKNPAGIFITSFNITEEALAK